MPLSGRGRESVRLLGQYKGSLLLLETPDALLLVDQHAAHERILYEALESALESERPTLQRLLVPRLLELSPAEGLRLAEVAAELRPLGFLVEPLSGRDIALTGVPGVLSEEQAVELLTALAAEVDGRPQSTDDLRRHVLEAVAASSACRSAIKIHRPLSWREMEELLARLFACEHPYACPHGRPTILEMNDADLERRFGRRGV